MFSFLCRLARGENGLATPKGKYMRSGLTFLALVMACLMGCSDVNVPNAKSTTGRAPQVAEVPEADETVRGAEDPPIVTLELGSRLKERRLSRSEELPGNIIVPNTNLNAVPVTAALQAVLEGTDVSLSWEAGTFENRLVTVTNLSGSLPKVVEKICASAKVFCGHRRGLLELKEKETFVIELPSVPGKANATAAASNTMADTIGELAGDKARVDLQGGNLLYTADVDGYERVQEYLTELRHGRPLLVMQLYIWEVNLNKENGTGINWTKFSIGTIGGSGQNAALSGLTGFSSLANPGVSLGAKFAGKVDADAVLKFLSTQGQVQTVSNPQLTFVSGSNAEFRVGGKQRYISQVGTVNSSVSTSTATSSSNNTVSTDSIDTGLTVTVSGSYEGGVITASLDLAIQDVVSLNETTTESGVTLDLPETSERKVSTSLRVRPGDNLVLAGLVSSRDTNDRDSLPFFGKAIPTFSHDTLQNSELVILVKPSIVKFSDPPEEKPAEKSRASNKEPLAAVMIDKDGAKPLAVPSSPRPAPAPMSAQPVVPVETKPELMTEAPAYQSLSAVPVEPSADGAPVDKRLLQRGFSHAFDDLQKPVSLSGTSDGGGL